MATFDGKFLHGILGPVTYRQVGETQVVSINIEPGTLKQTEATKTAAHTFGMASKLGSKIRELLYYELSMFEDGSVHYRLNTALNLSLMNCRDPATRLFTFEEQSLHGIVGFELNSSAKMIQKLPVNPQASISNGLLQLVFPTGQTPHKLKFVKKATACNLIFTVILFRLHEGLVSRAAERKSIMIQKDSPVLDGMSANFDVPNDCMCLVMVTLHYYNGPIPINEFKHNRSSVCEALFVMGIYQQSKKFLWAKTGVVFEGTNTGNP